jgi:hypothetical protein
MADIRDYLNWRGDLSFEISPFNEVDGLILSYLSYLDMDELFQEDTPRPDDALTREDADNKVKPLPDDDGGQKSSEEDAPDPVDRRIISRGRMVPLKTAVDQYFLSHTEEEIARLLPPFNHVPSAARLAADSVRFGSVMVSDYLNLVNCEAAEQMCAMTFWLDESTAFVSFRGTDMTIAGWKEDFGLSYMPVIPSQRHAVQYLNSVFGKAGSELKIYAGGHSKGGNLAVYAASFSAKVVRDRIVHVYACDAPGFRPELIRRAEYRAMLSKITRIVPDSSIIGGLLETGDETLVIKSSEAGLLQHDAISWQVLGTSFVRSERSDLGRFFDESMRGWISGLKDTELEAFTDALFSFLGAGGARTLTELKEDPLRNMGEMLKASRLMDSERKQEFNSIVIRLIKSGMDVLREQGGEKYEAFREQSLERYEALKEELRSFAAGEMPKLTGKKQKKKK